MDTNILQLPPLKKIKELPTPFPTRWQCVLFNNYGMVDNEVLARVLQTDVQTVEREATRLGLENKTFENGWITRGYITLIRSNWHHLNYSQLCTLLSCTEKELAFTLKEDDFLSVKLGGFKPDVEPTFYRKLTEAEEAKTCEIGDFVRKNLIKNKAQRFDFYSYDTPCVTAEYEGERIVYSFAAVYGDFLLSGDFSSFPEELLLKLKGCGVNGLWMQGLLSLLAPHPFAEECEENRLKRIKNLNLLVERLAKYGIKLYLYLNEPRSVSNALLPSSLVGHTEGDYSAMCSSQKQTWDYLYSAVKYLVERVSGLGGFITITMSENITHCRYRTHTNCPRCKNVPQEELASKIPNTILRAVKDANSGARVIANVWGWNFSMEWTDAQVERGISLLDKDIAVMSVSETALKINKGGVENLVIDYSVSCGAESEYTKKVFEIAQKTGHSVLAKVQINNSWECSAVPCIPVFDLVAGHVSTLRNDGVKGYMYSWTLGAYPSISLELAMRVGFENEFNLFDWYKEKFDSQAEAVHDAIKQLCSAFTNLPFDVNLLYFSPLNVGAANPWYYQNTEREATMVGFPFDDVKTWRGVYLLDVFTSQLGILSKEWNKGVDMLSACNKTPQIAEILRFATVCGIHFESTYLQVCFNSLKGKSNLQELVPLIERERILTKKLYEIISQDSRIGFEASNHYFYTENSLLFKLVSLEQLLKDKDV